MFYVYVTIADELKGMIRKMGASKKTKAIVDDSFWAKKRIAQRADYASRNLSRKSIFLSKGREFVKALSVNLGKEVNYDYGKSCSGNEQAVRSMAKISKARKDL